MKQNGVQQWCSVQQIDLLDKPNKTVQRSSVMDEHPIWKLG